MSKTTSLKDPLYEQIENCFDQLVISNSGNYIEVTFGDKSINVDYEAFLELRKKLEAVVAQNSADVEREAHRARVATVTTIAKDDPLQDAFDTWVDVNGQRFGIHFEQLNHPKGGDE